MSFYGHEIHVGVDCFSVEPLGLRPGGSLFLPPCELINQNPLPGFRSSLGNDEGLVTTLHQFDLGGIANVVVNECAKVAHGGSHIGERMVVVCAGYPAFLLPAGNHLGSFELVIERRFHQRAGSPQVRCRRKRKTPGVRKKESPGLSGMQPASGIRVLHHASG